MTTKVASPLTATPASMLPQGPLLDALSAYAEPGALADRLGISPDAVPPRLWVSALIEPAHSFLARPGKAFRARLVELGWAFADGIGPCPTGLIALVELLHAGSLIVDDIQDGSALRRGEPTLHRTHGMPLALNTGNWMYFAALGLIDGLACPPAPQGRLYREAVRMMTRCHHGQALDISVHIGLLAHHEVAGVVETTTRLKTGALMGWAAGSAAITAGADDARVDAITRFGESLGMALQMLDDLSGLLNPARRDKGLEDLRGARPTWPWAWLTGSVDEVTFVRLQHRARAVQDGAAAAPLAAIMARHVGHRGREAIAAQLATTFADLEAALGPHPALAVAREEIDRLGTSYL